LKGLHHLDSFSIKPSNMVLGVWQCAWHKNLTPMTCVICN